MAIIATVQCKGGTGKSTIAAHLTGWLVKRGQTVSVLDCDPQRAVSRWLREALPDVITLPVDDTGQILDLIPGMAKGVEHVVIDGPAGSAEPSRAILLRCDKAVLPCGPGLLDIRALRDTARLVEQARSIRNGKPEAIIVLNRLQLNTLVSREALETVKDIGIPVASTVLRQRVVFMDAPIQGALVWDIDKGLGEEIDKLFMEIIDAETETDDGGKHGELEAGREGLHPGGQHGTTDEAGTNADTGTEKEIGGNHLL